MRELPEIRTLEATFWGFLNNDKGDQIRAAAVE
jgi:hypothetical protein